MFNFQSDLGYGSENKPDSSEKVGVEFRRWQQLDVRETELVFLAKEQIFNEETFTVTLASLLISLNTPGLKSFISD